MLLGHFSETVKLEAFQEGEGFFTNQLHSILECQCRKTDEQFPIYEDKGTRLD